MNAEVPSVADAVADTVVAPAKPRLRGVLHQIACGVALVAGVVLVAVTSSVRGRIAAAIYMGSLTVLFGTSALYHRITWAPVARARMRRLDHSAIFVLIAGTYTPFGMLLPSPAGTHLLLMAWIGAGLGVVRAVFWVRAPKVVVAGLYVALGWAILPFLSDLGHAVDRQQMVLLAAGGLIYTVGAVVYALKKPNLYPAVFGYHELFHALTLVASGCHLVAVVCAVRTL